MTFANLNSCCKPFFPPPEVLCSRTSRTHTCIRARRWLERRSSCFPFERSCGGRGVRLERSSRDVWLFFIPLRPSTPLGSAGDARWTVMIRSPPRAVGPLACLLLKTCCVAARRWRQTTTCIWERTAESSASQTLLLRPAAVSALLPVPALAAQQPLRSLWSAGRYPALFSLWWCVTVSSSMLLPWSRDAPRHQQVEFEDSGGQ